jgi:hypothetical protein
VSRQDAADGGAQANGGDFPSSSIPTISADGRFVAFQSSATNLIPGGGPDVNGTNRDVFVFDRRAATTDQDFDILLFMGPILAATHRLRLGGPGPDH